MADPVVSASPDAVLNQSPPFEGVDLHLSDAVLRRAVAHEGSGEEDELLTRLGRVAGSAEAQAWARLANTCTPVLKTHDSNGRRIDRVEFHPAYHELMATSAGFGVHALSAQPSPHVGRAARVYLAIQMEAGHVCPLTMTNAAVPVLQRAVDLTGEWISKARSKAYDPRHLPMAEKTAVTLGMGMTEKQGGTDVRANTTRAEPLGRRGGGRAYAVTGHKWFMSAPMSDAFLVLAQAQGGLTCLLMPRIRADGANNALHFQRLKDKLGNRSNASSEVEFHGAQASAIGEEGEGTRVIIDMVTQTRLDCAVASAGLMRSALAQAIHHAQHRSVFQKRLIDQPLMQHVLADMALDVEAAVALTFRLAKAFDGATALDLAWKRVMTPVIKFWTCKTAPPLAAEAMECLGGNGYVEETPLARIYREVPVNSIWEGSGNVMSLDLVRSLRREQDAVAVVMADLKMRAAADTRLAAAFAEADLSLCRAARDDAQARAASMALSRLAAGIIMVERAPSKIAEAYVAARFSGKAATKYGAALQTASAAAIVDEAAPVLR